MNRAYRLVADERIAHQTMVKGKIRKAQEDLDYDLRQLLAQLSRSGFLEDETNDLMLKRFVAAYRVLDAYVRWLD